MAKWFPVAVTSLEWFPDLDTGGQRVRLKTADAAVEMSEQQFADYLAPYFPGAGGTGLGLKERARTLMDSGNRLMLLICTDPSGESLGGVVLPAEPPFKLAVLSKDAKADAKFKLS